MIILLFIVSLLCKQTRIVVNEYSTDELLAIKHKYKKIIGYINIKLITKYIVNEVIDNNSSNYKLDKEDEHIVKSILHILYDILPHCKISYSNNKNEISIDLCQI